MLVTPNTSEHRGFERKATTSDLTVNCVSVDERLRDRSHASSILAKNF
jgi:hypothetical protein